MCPNRALGPAVAHDLLVDSQNIDIQPCQTKQY
jgi:hypothetical protein